MKMLMDLTVHADLRNFFINDLHHSAGLKNTDKKPS